MSEPLYHGTDRISLENIVENGINLNQNPRGGDFAVGFYLTPILKSAISMGLRKSFRCKEPSVVELTLKKDYRERVKIKDFGCISIYSTDEDIMEWAQFIVNNRCGLEYIQYVSEREGFGDNNLDKRYDIVIGTIADGSVTQIARKCKAEKRRVTLEEAKKFLDKSFGVQYCISTEEGLSVIENKPREKKGVRWR